MQVMDRSALYNSLKDAFKNPYIILLAIVVTVSAGSLKNDFLFLDDQGLIVQNPNMQLPLRELPSIFARPMQFEHGRNSYYYRPILELLYIFNFRIWGANPVGFHLVNIMFYFLCTIFVYRIGLILFKEDKMISLIAASLFAVHPVNNEPLLRVAMNENIYGLFMISSIYFFIRDRKYLSCVAFALAVLSKESAAMLPFALCVLSIHRDGFKRGLHRMLPYTVVLGAYLVLRLVLIEHFWSLVIAQSLQSRILTMVVAFSDYIRLLIVPYPLHFFYPPRLYVSLLQLRVVLAIAVLASFFFMVIRLRKNAIYIFLLLSTFVLLVPAVVKTDTLPLGTDTGYIAERLLHVPAMIFSLFIVSFAIDLAGAKARQYVEIGLATVIIAFAGITMSLASSWENNRGFFTKLVYDAPHSATVHYSRGELFESQGRFDEAIKEYSAAFHPDHLFYIVRSEGGADGQEGKVITSVNRKVDTGALARYLPAFASNHFALGRVFLAQGKTDKAIRKFKVALTLKPEYKAVHRYLAQAYMKKGEFKRAREEFCFVLQEK